MSSPASIATTRIDLFFAQNARSILRFRSALRRVVARRDARPPSGGGCRGGGGTRGWGILKTRRRTAKNGRDASGLTGRGCKPPTSNAGVCVHHSAHHMLPACGGPHLPSITARSLAKGLAVDLAEGLATATRT